MRFVLIAAAFLALSVPARADTAPAAGGLDPVPANPPQIPAAPASSTPPATSPPAGGSISPEALRALLKALPAMSQPPGDKDIAAPVEPAGPPPPVGSVPDIAMNCNQGLLSYQAGTPDIHTGECSGFVDAVLESLHDAPKDETPQICITGHVTEMSVIRLFTSWAERHPEPISAWEGLHKALREAYPCTH